MSCVPSQKRFLSAGITLSTLIFVFGVFGVNCSAASAAGCVKEYLETTFADARKHYVELLNQTRVGDVAYEPYLSPQKIEHLSQERRRSQIGEITGHGLSDEHWLSSWIKKIHGVGAELRLLEYETKSAESNEWVRAGSQEGAYFYYDSEKGVPVLAVARDSTPESIAHETDHMEKWLARRDEWVRQGYSVKDAGWQATLDHDDPKVVQYIERTAVAKQIQQQSLLQREVSKENPVKWQYPSGALPFTRLDMLTRILTYPEAAALLIALRHGSEEGRPLMRQLTRKALLLRLTAYQRAQKVYLSSQLNANEPGLALDVDSHLQFMQQLQNLDLLFQSLFSSIKLRFEQYGVYDEAESLFEAELPVVWESLPAKKRGDIKPRFKAGPETPGGATE